MTNNMSTVQAFNCSMINFASCVKNMFLFIPNKAQKRLTNTDEEINEKSSFDLQW